MGNAPVLPIPGYEEYPKVMYKHGHEESVRVEGPEDEALLREHLWRDTPAEAKAAAEGAEVLAAEEEAKDEFGFPKKGARK